MACFVSLVSDLVVSGLLTLRCMPVHFISLGSEQGAAAFAKQFCSIPSKILVCLYENQICSLNQSFGIALRGQTDLV